MAQGTESPVANPTNTELVDLLQLTVARVRAHFAATTARLGVTPAQAKALQRLGDPAALSDLASRLGADVSNTSTVVDRLESQGLLCRTTHKQDRRVRLLTLTADGHRVREALEAEAFGAVPPFDVLTAEQRRHLHELLTITSKPS